MVARALIAAHSSLEMAIDMSVRHILYVRVCLCSGHFRSYFCYDCLVPFTPVPEVKLPFNLFMCARLVSLLCPFFIATRHDSR